MHDVDNLSLMDQVPRRGVRKPDSRSSPTWDESPNAPGIRWTIPPDTITPAESDIEQRPHPAGSIVYDALDRRLMDTFPASDAVARY
jgi:hypothetical protein